MPGHPIADARSLALHRAVAARVATDPRVLARARARVEAWQTEGRPYAKAWSSVLAGEPGAVAFRIASSDPEMAELRQSSPFAGALEPRERWRVWRSVERPEQSP